MQTILPYEEELLSQKRKLQRRFRHGTNSEEHDIQYTAKILVASLFDEQKRDIDELCKEKYDECVEATKSADFKTIEQSVLRILGLGQAEDYVPAILWLGAFSEKILEDFEEAAYYFRRAAAFGNGEGMFHYGMLMLNKKVATPPNVSVKKCFTDAAEHGISEANEILLKYWNERLEDPGLERPAAFYASCVKLLHDTSLEFGKANLGIIFIPELIPLGRKVSSAIWNSAPLHRKYESEVEMFYYVIFVLSIEAGMLISTVWHESFDHLYSCVDNIVHDLSGSVDSPLMKSLKKRLAMNEELIDYYQALYVKWLGIHAPYWKSENAYEYLMQALTAAFQLGVSINLELLGY